MSCRGRAKSRRDLAARALGRPAPARESGLTLIEVLLAIAIASIILLGVLNFYLTTARLRDELEGRADALSEARLLLEKISSELASAASDPDWGPGLSGGPDSIEILTTVVPGVAAWQRDPEALGSGLAVPEADRHRVRWSISGARPLIAEPAATDAASPAGAGATGIATDTLEGSGAESAAPRPVPNPTANSAGSASASESPAPSVHVERSELVLPPATAPEEGRERRTLRVADHIGFLRFRYFDGTSWLGSWSAQELPLAVEITLGEDALPLGTSPDDYPFERSRRVVRVPGAGALVAGAGAKASPSASAGGDSVAGSGTTAPGGTP